MNVVYALATTTITTDLGLPVAIRRGQTWSADDPLVKARPTFFSKKPVSVHTSLGEVDYVEQATAAPGEKRNVSR